MSGGAHPAFGIDFGTSNSAVSYAASDSLARLVPLEGAATSMPTAVFFNSEDHSTHFGREAVALYLTGGSSSLRPFQQLLRLRFPGTPIVEGDLFGGVASDLTYVGMRS